MVKGDPNLLKNSQPVKYIRDLADWPTSVLVYEADVACFNSALRLVKASFSSFFW